MEGRNHIVINYSWILPDNGGDLEIKHRGDFFTETEENSVNEAPAAPSGSNLTDVFNTVLHQYPVPVKQFQWWEIVLKVLCYSVIICVSFLGNSAVIVTVIKNRRMRSTTDMYILNLAICDVMVTLACTWVHLVDDLTEGWVLGAFFCKFNSFFQGKN